MTTGGVGVHAARSILRVELVIRADFEWNDRVHGTVRELDAHRPQLRPASHANGRPTGACHQVEPWWIWTEDADNEHFHHTEYFLLHKKQKDDEHRLVFTIPIFEPLPTQYFVKCVRVSRAPASAALRSYQHPRSGRVARRPGPCRTAG